MKRNKSTTASGKVPPKTVVHCHISKRNIVAGDGQRADGIRITRQSINPLTTKDLATDIQETCSLTRGDVVHVLSELQNSIGQALRNGQMVCLDKIGTFDISVGTVEPMYGDQKVNDSDIVVKGITFRPSEALLAELEMVNFKVSSDNRDLISESDSIPLVRQWLEEHDVLTKRNYATLCHCSRSTTQRRIQNLLDAHLLEPYPHSTSAYIAGANLRSTAQP